VNYEPTYLFAVAALMVSAISPLLVVWFQSRIARSTREREDRTAALLLNSNAKIAKVAAGANAETAAALGKIHTLVNSNLTDAQKRELSATRVMLASMREVVTLKEDRGIPINAETDQAIQIAEDRIRELASDLVHKDTQTELANGITEKPH
jgi:hypothetical protein